MKIVVIGEILWDVFGSTEHLGGASFNFAANARRLGHEVIFISGVGDDERGNRALARMEALSLSTHYVRRVPGQPTGIVTVGFVSSQEPVYHLHRPAAYDFVELDQPNFAPDWIYFGTLHQMAPRARSVTHELIASNPSARRFYDINLRPDSYTPELINYLMQLAHVVKLNEAEVREVERLFDWRSHSLEDFCRSSVARFGWQAVCVTRGAAGCAVLIGDTYVAAPAYQVQLADPVGAGDAFAAAFLDGLHKGHAPAEIADSANRAGALAASRSGAV